MHTYLPSRTSGKLAFICLCFSLFSLLPQLANAAGTGYNTTYVNGVKTITLPVETAVFTSGPDVVLVTETCTECHSADYPTTQPSQSRDGWLAVIEKMEHNFEMAPLTNTDQSLILDYLTTYYGH